MSSLYKNQKGNTIFVDETNEYMLENPFLEK